MRESTPIRRTRRLAVAAAVLGVAAIAFAGTTADGATPPTSEIYVANYNAGTVSQLGVTSTGAASSLAYPTAPSTTRPSHTIVSPNGKYAYALDCLAGQIRQYTVDTAGLLVGALVPMSVPSTAFGGCVDGLSSPNGHGLVENKAGTFVYLTSVVGSGGLTDLLSFKVGTTGALTQANFAEEPNIDPSSVAITPTGKFLLVALQDGLLLEYSLTTTGVMTPGPVVTVGGCLSDVAVNGTGKNVYITDSCGNRVVNYSISTTGALTLAQTIATGSTPTSIVISPTSRAAYVTNKGGSGSLSQYTASTTGVLAALAPGSWPVGVAPVGVAMTKSGKFLYVTNSGSGTISAFNVNTTTHQLTPQVVPTVGAGGGAWGIAIRN